MLQKFLTPPAPVVAEQCQFCATPVPTEHSHVAHIEKRQVLCACRGCYLLFTAEGAGGGKVRAIPEDVVKLPQAPSIESLDIPVGMAFFFYNSVEDRPVAFYPSPAGATECHLPVSTWDEAVRSLQPDVQALLVRQQDAYVVPIDACYELVGLMRVGWRGFHGGDEVHQAIDDFFARLDARAR